jgi:hypothetical protein
MNEELVYICEICQTVLEEYQCRAVCPNCGRVFDCTDLCLLPANAKISANGRRLITRPGSDPRDALPELVPDNPEPPPSDPDPP